MNPNFMVSVGQENHKTSHIMVEGINYVANWFPIPVDGCKPCEPFGENKICIAYVCSGHWNVVQESVGLSHGMNPWISPTFSTKNRRQFREPQTEP